MESTETEIGNGKTFKMRALTFGEACKILDESTVIDKKTLVPRVDSAKHRLKRLATMIVDPKMTEGDIAELCEADGIKLEEEARRLNSYPLVPSPLQSSPPEESTTKDKSRTS